MEILYTHSDDVDDRDPDVPGTHVPALGDPWARGVKQLDELAVRDLVDSDVTLCGVGLGEEVVLL